MCPRINWFAPLPPAKSGIATDFNFAVIPKLSQLSDLTLWTAQAGWDAELGQFASINRFSPDDHKNPQFQSPAINVFNIGNNAEFHTEIFELSRRLPGIVILHELNLYDLFVGTYWRKNLNVPDMTEAMEISIGRLGRHTSAAYSEGPRPGRLQQCLPFTPAALSAAYGVITHSRGVFQKLALLNRHPITCLHLPLPEKQLPPREFRANSDSLRLVMFGHLGSNRCLDRILCAMASYHNLEKLQLDVFGELQEKKAFQSLVERLGLAGRVIFHGFVPEETVDHALASADLAINLRYPTMGESSASLLRTWQNGLPALVTPIGWYREQPTGAVGHVRPGHETADLHRHFDAFFNDPAHYRKMGERGQQHFREHHNPAIYAQNLVHFAEKAASYRTQAIAQRLLNDILPRLKRAEIPH